LNTFYTSGCCSGNQNDRPESGKFVRYRDLDGKKARNHMKYHCLIILSAFVLMSCQSTRDKKVAASTAEEATPTPESIEGIPERNPAVFLERFNRGIDFVATGNEPFWSVDIDFEGSMHFKHMDEIGRASCREGVLQ